MPSLLKQSFFLVALVLLLLTLAQPVLAVELSYSTIPGFPNINNSTQPANGTTPAHPTTAADYIDYFFGMAMILAGVVGVFSIVVAGFTLLVSAGNPTVMSEAKERIFGCVLGIVLLLFSFIILRTINPSLVNPSTVNLQAENGVFFLRPQLPYNPGHSFLASLTSVVQSANPLSIAVANADTSQNSTMIPAPDSDEDTTGELVPGEQLVYNCTVPDGPDLLVWTFTAPNEPDNDPQAVTDIVPCTGSGAAASKLSLDGVVSFRWAYEQAGIYLYKGANCTGLATDAITTSQTIPESFQKGLAKSALLINDANNDYNVGFLLNNGPGLKGKCSDPFMNFDSSYPLDSTNTGLCVELNECATTTGGGGTPTTHNVCINNTCASVTGAGADGCAVVGASCSTSTTCITGADCPTGDT